MTVVIGFACKDALVVASDSQMTDAGRTRLDEKKIFSIPFGQHHHAMVGIAGSLASAGRFLEILENKAESTKVENSRSIADALEQSITETRLQFLQHIRNDEMPKDDRNQFLEDLYFQAMLAFYHDGKPYIYWADFLNSVATKGNRAFESLGSGRDIANIAMRGYPFELEEYTVALGFAYYAIDLCRENDTGCGGPFQHLVLYPDSRPALPHGERLFGAYDEVLKEINDNVPNYIAHTVCDAIDDWEKEQKKSEKRKARDKTTSGS